MSELANYSIETDQSVWLSFKDGRSLRVGFVQLPKYLAPRDLVRVRRAMKLRRDFLRHNMPRTLIGVLAIGIAALVVTGGHAVAQMMQSHHLVAPEPNRTEIVRHIQSQNHLQIIMPTTPTVAAGPIHRRTGAKLSPVSTIKPASSKLNAPAVIVTPIAVPDMGQPQANPESSPLSSPPPVATPAAGNVLGSSTTPAPSPTPPPLP